MTRDVQVAATVGSMTAVSSSGLRHFVGGTGDGGQHRTLAISAADIDLLQDLP